MRVAMMAPMKPELAPLVRKLKLQRRDVGELRVHETTLDGVEVVATITGIGTEAAIAATERLLDAVDVDHVLVVGIAGGRPSTSATWSYPRSCSTVTAAPRTGRIPSAT